MELSLYIRHLAIPAVFFLVLSPVFGASAPSAADLVEQLKQISLDPDETYRVRDLHLVRGDLKLYFNEGTISFTRPVVGRSIAMMFTAAGAELGDAELIVLPPRRSDRESLLHFVKTPNLNEHFREAVFLFTDDTYADLHRQLADHSTEKTPDQAVGLGNKWNALLRNLAADIDVRLLEALLNGTPDGVQAAGLFEGVIQGQSLGPFDISFQPDQTEPIALGRVSSEQGALRFQLWTSFRPRSLSSNSADPPPIPAVTVSDFHIETTIGPDLKQICVTQMTARLSGAHTRALRFEISDRMTLTGATVDGEPAEFYQRSSLHHANGEHESNVLIAASRELNPNQTHQVVIRHEGTVVSETANGVYLVADRNVWFPHVNSSPANFDLVFHVPSRFQVVSIGKLVDEHVEGETRVVHRQTETPARYAGFNFGEFQQHNSNNGQFHIECYANRALFSAIGPAREVSERVSEQRLAELSGRAEALLAHYVREWGPLPFHSIAIAPIPGYFGQGFPGLIYLSTLSYLHSNERPIEARDPLTEVFLSDLLLAHEIAHQWWGNLVSSTDYRSEWIMESIANYAALELLEDSKGVIARDELLRYYRRELTSARAGAPVPETIGPIEWGQRLIDMGGMEGWRIITYEKGTWIMHMLRERMGRDAYHRMLRQMIREYSSKPLSNDEFRQVASQFMPAGEPDASLELFFDTWVYGTGIPHLALAKGQGNPKAAILEQNGVPDDFTFDVPVTLTSLRGQHKLRWVRSNSDGVSIPLTRGESVELPSPTDFLYVP